MSLTMPDMEPEAFTAEVGDAVWAPSIHNSQPWQFRRTGKGVDVTVDGSHRVPACDPDGRMARISCGAATFSLRLALAATGLPARYRFGRDPVLVHLWPAPPRPPTPVERRWNAGSTGRSGAGTRYAVI